MKAAAAVGFVLLSLPAVMAQAQCGPGKGSCGQAQPCCSTYGMCGSTPLHCGGGCQGAFSFSKKPEDASCYADRASLGRKCVSGRYDFSNSTWLQNAEAYIGDHRSTDFVVDNYSPETVARVPGSGLTISLNAPPNNDRTIPGTGGKLSSTSYMMYGTFSAKIKAAPGSGVVTAFISMADEKDEIDWEWTGGRDIAKAQTNFFIKGALDYTKSVSVPMGRSTAEEFHVYSVEWTKDKIVWLIDGKQVRTVSNHNINTPSLIQFSVWDGGAGSEGTRNWAGGYVNWAASKKYTATFEWVSIQCAGDQPPTGPPARDPKFPVPTLNDKPLKMVVPGLPGYDVPSYNGTTPDGKINGTDSNNQQVPEESSASILSASAIVAVFSTAYLFV